MSADTGKFFDNPAMMESYHQAQALTWWGRPYRFNPPRVCWENNFYIPDVAGDIVGCSETEILRYHRLESLTKFYGVNIESRKRVDRKVYSRRILRYFLNLSQRIGKQIELYSRVLTLDNTSHYRFELRVDPCMTWRSRVERMKTLARDSGETLARDDNVTQVFFGGSAQKGTRYPGDVDLLVITREQLTSSTSDYLPYDGPLSSLPFATCNGRDGNPFEFLHRGTLFQLGRVAENAGFRLDCIIVPQNIFQNPSCCPTHARLIREFREGLDLSQ